MTMLRVDHETRLIYSEPVVESVLEVRMAPPSTEDQTLFAYKCSIEPNTRVTTYRDGFGNRVDLCSILPPHRDIVLRASSCVRLHRRHVLQKLQTLVWPGEQPLDLSASEYLRPSTLVPFTPEVVAFANSLPQPSGSMANVIEQLVEAIQHRMKYVKKVTNARTPVGEALSLGQGVCQDFAHLQIALCRHIGLPARYVSGYIHQPGELATHAWCQIWCGQSIGWVDIDPTHAQWVEFEHVVTAIGRDYRDVPPNRGVWKGNAEETIQVLVNVQPTDRIPSDLVEWSDTPIWSQSNPVSPPSSRNDRQHQQQRNQLLRQQQSQQQQ